jgi:hypothetical protein
MINPNYIPSVNDPLNGPGIEMVIDAVKKRRVNFPDEPIEMTLALILLNIGARFTPLECSGKEWRGFKKDLFLGGGTLTCPNGHEIEKGQGITLGWVLEPE